MQAGEFVSHRSSRNDDDSGRNVAAAGTVLSRGEEQIILHTNSEVTGNIGRDNSTMYNAAVDHRTEYQSGNTLCGGPVTFNLHLNTQDGQLQTNRLELTRIEESLQDIEMQDDTASAQSHIFVSRNTSRDISTSQGSQAVLAWKQQSKGLLDGIHHIIDNIRERHEKIGQKFRSLDRRTPAREDFELHEELFEVTLEEGHLFHRIEETFKKEQSSVVQAVHYYRSNPNQALPDVKEVHNRLNDILENLKSIERHFEDASSIAGSLVHPRRQKQTNRKGSRPLQALRSAIHKPPPKNGRRDAAQYSSLPAKLASRLRSKIKLLLKLMNAFQDFVVQKLAPPSSETRDSIEPNSDPGLPEEVQLAQVAAAMLYESLGNVCPNPNHDSHNVCFKLGTQESIQDIKKGTKRGRFGLRVAFESSTTSQTWFDVASILTYQEADQLPGQMGSTAEAHPDMMDTDTVTQSAESDVSFDLVALSRRQHQARLQASPWLSSLKSKHSIEHTAHFCLYNYRQQTKELAALLKHSEVCEHCLYFPAEQDLKEVASDGVQIQTLCALVRERLSRRDRIRLARIIAESFVKFNATEWLRDDMDGKNVLVYNIDKHYEPYLRVQIAKPGTNEQLSPGATSRMSETLLKFAGILSDIALGPNVRRSNESEEKLYGKVKKQLSMGYANVVRECQNMAKMQDPDMRSNEAVMTAFHTKVVTSLRNLEESFKIP